MGPQSLVARRSSWRPAESLAVRAQRGDRRFVLLTHRSHGPTAVLGSDRFDRRLRNASTVSIRTTRLAHVPPLALFVQR
jgi:hypothetical protein